MKKSKKKNYILFFILGAVVFLVLLFGGIFLNVSYPALAKFLGALIIPLAIVTSLSSRFFPAGSEKMTKKLVTSPKSISFMEGISCLFLFTIIVFSALMIFVSLNYYFNP